MVNYWRRYSFAILILYVILLTGCKHKPTPDISFYYWKSQVKIGAYESKVLEENSTRKLYVRYFDVDINPEVGIVTPIAMVIGNKLPPIKIVPVVFIKDRVFDKLSDSDVDSLSRNVARLITKINGRFGINPAEVQFDCDWTIRTKDRFFHFLRRYKELTNLQLSATIRLHQVKYPERTGIPPVDKGVLMYYNMGSINAGNGSSIYDRKIAQKYNSSLSLYPLPLDIALPIFTWGIQIRQNQVVHLLNKMNESHFIGDSHFTKKGNNRYLTVVPCFKGGYYFKRGDEIKIETISAKDLKMMVKDISKNIRQQPQSLIFYDLDSINIQQYDEKIFQKMANRMR